MAKVQQLSQTFKSCLIIYAHAISPISHRLTGIQLLSFISKFVKPLSRSMISVMKTMVMLMSEENEDDDMYNLLVVVVGG